VANLPPVSTTLAKLVALRISPRIFEKIRNDPNGILGAGRELIYEKKTEAKNLVSLSL
jgi:hypothetical protein